MAIPDVPFEPFPKIPRLSRDVVVTEKIDGTNALVYVSPEGLVYAGSRTRWIEPGNDNYGFAKWVAEHTEDLANLGPGFHYGEWWGAGVQRRYGLSEKRFSLFNVARWGDSRPACCGVVPTLWTGNYDDMPLEEILHNLRTRGSVAAPGFADPEGVVIYHVASGQLFKKLLSGDSLPKGTVPRAERELEARRAGVTQ